MHQVTGMGPTNSWKFWLMISWVIVPNILCIEWCGILSDKWWVTEIEWRVVSIEKKKKSNKASDSLSP